MDGAHTPSRAPATKRPRSPCSWARDGGLGWASWDCDTLDNLRQHKRSASDTIALELERQLRLLSQGGTQEQAPPDDTAAVSPTPPADPMCCSSLDSSPQAAPPPAPRSASKTPTLGGAPPGVRSRLGGQHAAPLKLAEYLPRSPSDAQPEALDLRKATLMRLLYLKASCGEEVQPAAAPPRLEAKSPLLAAAQGRSAGGGSATEGHPVPGVELPELEGEGSYGPRSMCSSPCHATR